MAGKKQVIRTGQIAGVLFQNQNRCLIDAAMVAEIIWRFPETAPVFGMGDGAIVDQKIMRDPRTFIEEEMRWCHLSRWDMTSRAQSIRQSRAICSGSSSLSARRRPRQILRRQADDRDFGGKA